MHYAWSFVLQLGIATAGVWLLAKVIKAYFAKRADKTGDYGITRLPEHEDDRQS